MGKTSYTHEYSLNAKQTPLVHVGRKGDREGGQEGGEAKKELERNIIQLKKRNGALLSFMIKDQRIF